MIDYDEIIENLQDDKIISLMESLGADNYIDKQDYIIFPTICHNESGGSMKLYYYKDSHLFMCYTNDGGMNIFTFLKKYYEHRGIEYDWKKDIWDVILGCSTSSISNKEDKIKFDKDKYKNRFAAVDLPIYNDSVLNIYTKFYPPEWLEEDITKTTMDRFNILYSIPENKIIIPHYNYKHELVGIRGRALNDDEIEKYGKYMPVFIGDKIYSHPLSLNLYGIYENLDNIKKTGYCIFFEGEKSVLKCDNYKMINSTVATCGSNLNKYQIDLIMKLGKPKEIILAYDNEEKINEDKYFDKLYNLCKKYENYINMSFIYDRENLTKKKDSPVDEGEEIFKELLNRRVKLY